MTTLVFRTSDWQDWVNDEPILHIVNPAPVVHQGMTIVHVQEPITLLPTKPAYNYVSATPTFLFRNNI